jgi:hypothetical protein
MLGLPRRYLPRRKTMLAKWPPLKLAQLAFVGSIVVALEFVSDLLSEALLRLHDYFFGSFSSHPAGPVTIAAFILISFASILVGGLLIWIAKRQLSAGLSGNKWLAIEVEKAHVWIESPTLKRVASGLAWVYVVDFVVYNLLRYAWGIHFRATVRECLGSFIFFLAPAFVLSNLRETLRPAPPARVPLKEWAGVIKGIYSEHWGGSPSKSQS